ncbi:hypothetical protein M404DRAFT_1008086 [Pisolithus tinctorius Marx 270]|uniref:Uncharacterized protein n=1 Tax=Pisolithus tinctorius Marx 270 TaxID=870435 RepID=A0A0C3I8D2_PISTI|nr:hypothetical protein M404DRAFT_1009017 [Pisolithus tinctorius Marx 270]KIN94749.1 hypothetical protein M404DRAFT_1008086 [Pisolithus tinctorius Marx 270]
MRRRNSTSHPPVLNCEYSNIEGRNEPWFCQRDSILDRGCKGSEGIGEHGARRSVETECGAKGLLGVFL